MKKMFRFAPKGVCSKEITFSIIDGKLQDVEFVKGCAGNAQGVSRLIEGMDAREAVRRLKGIECQNSTSCPDQLAQAIEEALNNNNDEK